MTKRSRSRTVPIVEGMDLAALLADAESGATIVLTRDGVPRATLAPIDDGGATTARESLAVYGESKVAAAQQPASALLRLIGGPAARAVLSVFLKDPDRRVHQREIARRAGLGLRSAQLALERLESLGLITATRDGNRLYYDATRTPQFDELRDLLGRELGIAGAVMHALVGMQDRIERAFIFGSVAAGTDAIGSDIDLLVVGDLSRHEMATPIAAAERELRREIDVVLYRPADFAAKRANSNHFVTEVLTAPRIDLIGGPDDA